jgi:hypothetical protein
LLYPYCFNPKTKKSKPGHASALGWALGIEDDPGGVEENIYNFKDALTHYFLPTILEERRRRLTSLLGMFAIFSMIYPFQGIPLH